MEELSSSLTKGCVLIKPVSSPKKKKKNEQQFSPVNFYPKFKRETDFDKLERYKAFNDCWQSISSQISEIQEEQNSKTLGSLIDFVSKVHRNKERGIKYPVAEVPTAGFVTGVNLPDHDVIFLQFVESLKENISPYSVILQSKDNTSLKLILQNTIDGLVKTFETEDSDESDSDIEDLLNTSQVKKNPYFKDYSLKELRLWYQEQITANKENKDSNDSDSLKPLVLIFEDFESFTSSVLQDFILIVSEYMEDLPFVFVFGIATTISAIHKSLPHFVSSRLAIEKFQSQPSLEILCEIIDKVLLSNENAFKLGPAVLQLLYDRFLCYDFSISNFINALKFAVLDHFMVKEFSLLCRFDELYIKEFINKLSTDRLNMLREIPSYLKFHDKQSQKEQKKLNTNENYFKSTVVELIEDLQAHEKIYFPIIKCLHELTVNLHAHPFGKRVRDVYCHTTVMKLKLPNEQKYVNAISLARMLPRDELLNIVTSSYEILKAAVGDDTNDEHAFSDTISKLEEYKTEFQELEKGTSKYDVESTSSSTTTNSAKVFKSRHDFTEQMKSAIKEKRKQSPYDKLRNDIIDTLDEAFKKHLISPLNLTFHEIFYYNDSYTVKQRVDGSPKEVMIKALNSPQLYLKCKCCSSSKQTESIKEAIENTLPDVSILFQLHLECGKLINLYDWLQTFMQVVEPSLNANNKKKKSKQKQKLEEQLQARFIRGVSELQHMGFIKSTKKKTDHVSRLTWGGC